MRDLFRIQLAPTFSGVLCGTKKKKIWQKHFLTLINFVLYLESRVLVQN